MVPLLRFVMATQSEKRVEAQVVPVVEFMRLMMLLFVVMRDSSWRVALMWRRESLMNAFSSVDVVSSNSPFL